MATKKNTGAKPVGRPSKFTQDLANNICERIASGESLRKLCADKSMPDARSVHRWLDENEAFCQQYARACESRQDFHFEEMLEIADNVIPDVADVAKARVQIDTRKWVLSRMNPKKYGDKITTEHTGSVGIELSPMSVLFDDE